MEKALLTHSLGFPRIGAHRELKKAVEAYWQGKISSAELQTAARDLRRVHWQTQQSAGIDLIPSNDFSLYDQVLDLSCLVGNVPPRFGEISSEVDLDTYFAMARGVRPGKHACDCGCAPQDTFACEMTKWFDTNYHYLVPEFSSATRFRLASPKPFAEFSEALALGLKTKPVLLGPVTYLSLGKVHDTANPGFDPFTLLPQLVAVYIEALQKLAALGAEWVQLDEPILVTDILPAQRAALQTAYAQIRAAVPSLQILVATYFGGLGENLATLADLPVDAFHLDLTRGGASWEEILPLLRAGSRLSLGIVDGRNIWKTDFSRALPPIEKAVAALGAEQVWLAPSCSLLHVPVSLRPEKKLAADLRSWLAFAEEKLSELSALRQIALGTAPAELLAQNQHILAARRASPRIHHPAVRERLAQVQPANLQRAPFAERQKLQRDRLRLPLFPTTTIGSFPQTAEVRSARARWRKGELSDEGYRAFLENVTAVCVRFQEEIGLDMPVHGEFERNDMVEYFGEQLAGFAFTANGWVQSYGSRCVKPPIIFGDVSRPQPMTVAWSRFAQSLTKLPMKGMLTGPVTILQWSFVRDDQPRRDTAWQIALALRDEVCDLEQAGIAAIQIDEPALREGLPLRRADRPAYLQWAVDAFRLSSAGVRPDTQIHTHMCYSEFNDIIGDIARLDADVITIEASRSAMDLLRAFVDFHYPNEIGPGVWDIHSPRVPPVEEMLASLRAAARVLPVQNLWVNPDCGLKTRGWPETRESLRNLVACARQLREEFSSGENS